MFASNQESIQGAKHPAKNKKLPTYLNKLVKYK